MAPLTVTERILHKAYKCLTINLRIQLMDMPLNRPDSSFSFVRYPITNTVQYCWHKHCPINVCVCVCVSVRHMRMCMQVHTHMEDSPPSPVFSALLVWDKVLLIWKHVVTLRWLPHLLSGFLCLRALVHSSVQGYRHIQLCLAITWLLGIGNQVSMLTEQTLWPMEPPSCPLILWSFII